MAARPGWWAPLWRALTRHPCLALFIFGLLAFAPGQLRLPPVDRDEARFAQASRQMVETGDLVDIRLQDEPRYKKPVGIYWLQAAGAAALGEAAANPIGVYRLPSWLAAAGTLALLAGIGRFMFGAAAGLFAGLLLAGTMLLPFEATQAKTDAVLLFTVVAMQAALARIVLGRVEGRPAGRLVALGFWTALAASILVKGPIGPLVALGTTLALAVVDRRARLRPFARVMPWGRDLRPVGGLLWLLLLVLPWFVAIVWLAGPTFWVESVGTDLAPKLAGGQEGHGAPPGYHILAFLLAGWPAAPLILLALPWAWGERHDRAVQFLFAWAVPAWIVFEAVPTKLIHYTLPLWPALALLAGAALADRWTGPLVAARRRGRGEQALAWLALGLAGLGALVLAAGALALGPAIGAPFEWAGLPVALCALAVGAGLVWALRHRRLVPALLTVALGGPLVAETVLAGLLPATDALWPGRAAHRLAMIERAGDIPPERWGVVGLAEPSLVVWFGTRTRLLGAEAARGLVESGALDGLIVACRADRPDCPDLIALSAATRPLGAPLPAFNMAKGQRLVLHMRRAGHGG